MPPDAGSNRFLPRWMEFFGGTAAFHDARRALQFLRSRAMDWNIDKSRIGAYGGSAGAMISMWLGFHNEMADPGSDDPVERESTRLAFIATQGGQLTFDRRWMEQSVPGNIIHKNPAFLRLFGVKSLRDLDRPNIQRWIRELSPITHLTANDPSLYMTYGMAPDALVPTDLKEIKAQHQPIGLSHSFLSANSRRNRRLGCGSAAGGRIPRLRRCSAWTCVSV